MLYVSRTMSTQFHALVIPERVSSDSSVERRPAAFCEVMVYVPLALRSIEPKSLAPGPWTGTLSAAILWPAGQQFQDSRWCSWVVWDRSVRFEGVRGWSVRVERAIIFHAIGHEVSFRHCPAERFRLGLKVFGYRENPCLGPTKDFAQHSGQIRLFQRIERVSLFCSGTCAPSILPHPVGAQKTGSEFDGKNERDDEPKYQVPPRQESTGWITGLALLPVSCRPIQ
jgi:hypothetical protein